MLISVVVPVYNNEGSLQATFDEIQREFRTNIPEHTFEVLFVNDGSKDGSLAELKKLKSKHPEAKVISFTRNFGQNSAMAAGNRHAKGSCVINVSADLQDPVELMSKMIGKWEEGFRIVACVREARQESILRSLPSNTLYRILRMSVPTYPEKGFDYYLIDRAVLDVINPFNNRNSFILFDILETGFQPHFIPYTRRGRKVGKSGYTFLKRLKASFDLLVNASYVPIRMMSLLGALTALTGFAYACSVAYARLTNQFAIPGYAPIVILILVLSGLNMLMIGMIGEYLWRAFDYIKARPDYVIQEKILD